MTLIFYMGRAGFLFRVFGRLTGQQLLGPKVVASMLMFATVSGILMALFLNTAGGAWDNAKKFIETGALGGKGSDTHKAAITGDTYDYPLSLSRYLSLSFSWYVSRFFF